ncbi:MAG TPA: hypothetical protein VH913_13890 [Hyphomicrobiaceae bacterium]|jgi:hypothetical protein
MSPTAEIMAGTSKVRLAVGLFGTAKELTSALAELSALGVAPARINVVAQADAFGGAFAGCWQSGEARAFANWIVCRSVGGAVPWAIAPAGPDETTSSTAVNDARALLGMHHWALRRHARLLHRCLEQGGALLLVEPESEAEERAVCTALLRYASGGIQTHEIARSLEG